MKRSMLFVLTALLVLSVLLSACAPAAVPTPQVIEKVVTKEVPGKEVVVTKEVIKEVPVIATPEPSAMEFPRAETLYVSGAA